MKIEQALVPVMKMRFTGIEIDLTFARLNKDDISQLKEEDLMDPATIKSIEAKRDY